MRHYVVILLLFICALSCNRESRLFLPDASIEYSLDTLPSVRLLSEQVCTVNGKARSIFAYSPYIILLTDDVDGYVKVYSAKDTLPVSLCPRGRANNEYILCDFSGQFGHNPSGDTLMYLQDIRQMKIINLSQSITKGKTVVEKMVDEGSVFQCRVFMSDTTVVFKKIHVSYEDARDNIYEPATFVVAGRKKSIAPYKRILKNDNFPTLPLHVYSGVMRLSPDRTKAVEALCYMDIINIFDLEKGTILSLKRKGAYSFSDIEDMSEPELESNMMITNTDVCVTDRHIMVLRSGKPAVENDVSARVVIVFDWNGDIIKLFELDNEVVSIAFDEATDFLYYLNDEGQIFKAYIGCVCSD